MKQDKKNSKQANMENSAAAVNENLEAKIAELEEALILSHEKEKRAIADYQNLLRRSRDERSSFVKMANKDFALAILQPLEHLSMAAAQVKDQGLDMVISQLWKELENQGLAEIEVLGKKFDLDLMEAVDKEGEGDQVVKVVRKGYLLNGEVIQHAQVVLA
jgi:molecular chaperone GrpE